MVNGSHPIGSSLRPESGPARGLFLLQTMSVSVLLSIVAVATSINCKRKSLEGMIEGKVRVSQYFCRGENSDVVYVCVCCCQGGKPQMHLI